MRLNIAPLDAFFNGFGDNMICEESVDIMSTDKVASVCGFCAQQGNLPRRISIVCPIVCLDKCGRETSCRHVGLTEVLKTGVTKYLGNSGFWDTAANKVIAIPIDRSRDQKNSDGGRSFRIRAPLTTNFAHIECRATLRL